MMTAFATSLLRHRRATDRHLRRFFQQKRRTVEPALLPVLTQLERFCLAGGKRLRAYLVVLGAAYVGRELPQRTALDLGAAVELGHAGILIHDDLIDRDQQRRGRPTVHVAAPGWFPRAPRPAADVGRLTALAAGNLLAAFATELFLRLPLTDRRKELLLDVAATTGYATAYGETFDIRTSAPGATSPRWTDLLAMQQMKTAPYSFEAPLTLGALAAGGNSVAVRELVHYATSVGAAFQLRDDVLGLTGTAALGKPIGSDMREGKLTPALHLARKRSTLRDRRTLATLLRRGRVNAADLARLRHILTVTGAADTVEKTATQHAASAKAWAQTHVAAPDVRALFRAVADFAITRNV